MKNPLQKDEFWHIIDLVFNTYSFYAILRYIPDILKVRIMGGSSLMIAEFPNFLTIIDR